MSTLNAPLLLALPQGEYCWTVNVTANINTTAASNGTLTLADYATANTMTVDAAPKASYTACFYKRAEQATANLTYDMCRLGKREYACRHGAWGGGEAGVCLLAWSGVVGLCRVGCRGGQGSCENQSALCCCT